MDFNRLVDDIINAEDQHRHRQINDFQSNDAPRKSAAEAFLRNVAPIGEQAFFALKKIGVQIHSLESGKKNPATPYVKLHPHYAANMQMRTTDAPTVHTKGYFFLTDLPILFGNGLLLHRSNLGSNELEVANYYRQGGAGESPVGPPFGISRRERADKLGKNWYTIEDIKRDFVRSYHNISGGALRDVHEVIPPMPHGHGRIFFDLVDGEVGIIWRNEHENSWLPDAKRLVRNLCFESIHGYLARVVDHEARLHVAMKRRGVHG